MEAYFPLYAICSVALRACVLLFAYVCTHMGGALYIAYISLPTHVCKEKGLSIYLRVSEKSARKATLFSKCNFPPVRALFFTFVARVQVETSSRISTVYDHHPHRTPSPYARIIAVVFSSLYWCVRGITYSPFVFSM